MAQQKLYTEEQVVRAMSTAVYYKYETYTEVLDMFTPIELPSDEEIEKYNDGSTKLNPRTYYDAFQDGAKWMRDKILQQNIG